MLALQQLALVLKVQLLKCFNFCVILCKMDKKRVIYQNFVFPKDSVFTVRL